MDFVVATIPTVLAIEESARLVTALREEGVPTSTIVVNQIIGPSMGEKYLKMKLHEQTKAMELLASSEHLKDLKIIKGKLLDLEVRGVSALQYFSTTLWQGIPLPAAGTGEGIVRKGMPCEILFVTPFGVRCSSMHSDWGMHWLILGLHSQHSDQHLKADLLLCS
jgi:hypothetical protein